MDELTSKDLEAIGAYLEALKALEEEEEPESLTPEDWEEVFAGIRDTGNIPEKYAGRVGVGTTTTMEGVTEKLDEDGNPVLDEAGEPIYEHVTYDLPQETTFYYDIEEDAREKRVNSLNDEYHDAIVKALRAYTKTTTGNVADILAELLEDPDIKRELEKELAAAQKTALAPLGSIPNGEPLNWLFRVISGNKRGRELQAGKRNRHEEIITKTSDTEDKVRFIRRNKQNKSMVIVEIGQANTYLRKTNKTFAKVFLFTLQKMTAQGFPLRVGFSLQELVDLGMYSSKSNAWRAVKAFFEQQKQTTLSGTVKKGRRTISEKGGILFFYYELENGFVWLDVNPNFNMEFIASYFTVFPRFAYALNNNAFSLVRYIFYLARQNAKQIKEREVFTVSLEAVRENLGLPSVDEVKNRRYRQLIVEPIEKAIEEVEEALRNVPEAKEYGFTITPHGTDATNINEWLQGYLEVGLKGDFAETFVRIATKAEEDRRRFMREKQKELARLAAKSQAQGDGEGASQ